MSQLKTYSEQIIEYIKTMLLNGTLRPGDKVNEVHLASALSISRAPVREALQMLTKEGLIVYMPQRGKFIKALTPREIKDSYYMGGVLEGAAVGACVGLFTENDFAQLHACIHEMAGLDQAAEYTNDFSRIDISFHKKLLSYTENKLIIDYSRNMCQRMSKFLLFRHWPMCFSVEEIVARHQRILDALVTRHPYTVELAIREHYKELGEQMSVYGCEVPPYQAG